MAKQAGRAQLVALVVLATHPHSRTSPPLRCFETGAEPREGNFPCSPVAELLAALPWAFLQVFLPNPAAWMQYCTSCRKFSICVIYQKKVTFHFTLSKLESHWFFISYAFLGIVLFVSEFLENLLQCNQII